MQSLFSTIEKNFYILRLSSITREECVKQLSYLSSADSSLTYNYLPSVLVIQLTKEAGAPTDIVINGFDLTGLGVTGNESCCLKYDLYGVCLYTDDTRNKHYRAVTYSTNLKRWILYESKCATVLNSFGSLNQFTSSEPYLLFYKQQKIPWTIPITSSSASTSNTVPHPVHNPIHDELEGLTGAPLSTPISNHGTTAIDSHHAPD